jgi:hypothetical protein
MKKIYASLVTLLFASLTFSQQIKSAEERLKEILIKGEIIARLDKNFDPQIVANALPKNYKVTVDKILSQPTDIWLFKFDTTEIDEQSLAREFYSVNGVVDAQINTYVNLRNAPNDPNYGQQWQHQNIDSEQAWQTTTGGTNAHGEDIVVCIIESANVMGHPDLQDNHWVNTAEIPGNGIDDDGNGYIDDYNGWNVSLGSDNIGTGNHGTQVAGMIGAKGNNGVGVAGANWNVKMMVVAGHNPNSQANIVQAYTYPLQQRILYNQTNGAQGAFVVATNASWGLDYEDAANYPIWCNFYDDLGQAGILNCGATANNNVDIDQVGDVPTGCTSEYMVAVTATNQNDVKTFAGYGINSINVAAPGDGIYTTNNSGYGFTQGTSFASPLTAGVIGLLYSIPCPEFMDFVKNDPEGAAMVVRNALYDGVDQTTQLLSMVSSGGRINANNSMNILMDNVCGSCMAPSGIAVPSEDETTITINFNPVADADGYIVKIRPVGSSTWEEYTTTNTTYTFTGLDECTEYEIVVQTDCDDEESNNSQIMTVRTKGCGECIEVNYCVPQVVNPNPRISIHSPQSIATIINNYTETSGWGAPFDAGYNYGNFVLVDDGSSNSEEGCDALINGAAINGNVAVVVRGSCNFSQKALNAQNAGATAVIIVNNQTQTPNQLGAGGTAPQVNIPVVMISQNAGSGLLSALTNGDQVVGIAGAQNEFIQELVLGNDNFPTGDDNGYLDAGLFHQVYSLGEIVNFEMTPGFDGQDLPLVTRIWIDQDQDGIYTANELVYDQNAPSFGVHSGVFTIPSSAQLGSTRLRVQTVYQGPDAANKPATGCNNFTSGEVEDYCIEIREGQASTFSFNPQQFVIYPNPTNELLNIKVPTSEASTIQMFDPSGKLVKNERATGEITKLNISNLESGIYITKIIDKNGTTIHIARVSVQK